MKVIDFIRLVRKHLVLLILAPLLLAILVILLTLNPDYKYSSQTTLYTGIATGSSVEMDKSFNYFATNTAFDNLINIIKSRNTQQEVAIRLLSQHLLLKGSDPKYISAKSLEELKRITPNYIYSFVVSELPRQRNTPAVQSRLLSVADSLLNRDTFSFGDNKELNANEVPAGIDPEAYEQTVKNLSKLMDSSDTNFVYKLLNFPNPHYSFKDISGIKVQRIGTSDLVQLNYECDDPGICQQTLAIMTNVCVRNYRDVKENRSDAVVKYFEHQLKQAAARLKVAEDKLLEFNKANNIINYYEQSKAVAVVKEDLDVEYNNKRIKLAGLQAAIKRLEEKMGIQEQIQLKSAKIMTAKNQLGDLNYRIETAETYKNPENGDFKNLYKLKAEADKLKEEIKAAVSELYSYGNSREGLPLQTILTDWITNVIEAENIKAGLDVLGERIKEFQKQYSIYAPAGANIKRIEREISVSEQEFLEILHGLNLAKLKMQDNELSSNIKVVDLPYYPLSPIPTKRKILVLLALVVGFILVLSSVLLAEYFDQTLKNPAHASKVLKLASIGLIPKILLKTPKIPISTITNRLLEITIQNIELCFKQLKPEKQVKTLLFFSTQPREGKSVVAGNLALSLKNKGKKVLYLNYNEENVLHEKGAWTSGNASEGNNEESIRIQKPSILNQILCYADTRIDYESPFLAEPEKYLARHEFVKYRLDESFTGKSSYQELIGQSPNELPDFVLIEIPSILNHSYPVDLVAGIDLPVLVCRSNRVWSEADQSALDIISKIIGKSSHFILNGVELEVIESVLGELPKKRSKFRRAIKKLVLFQFLSRTHL
jgi:polysaccharide biosynthesis transport protein